MKKIKQKEIRKQNTLFCPKCESVDINQDKSTMQSLGYLPTKYICGNCGLSSFTFPEIDLDKVETLKTKKFNVKENKSELVDTSYGNFYVKVMWKILGLLSIIFGIIFYWSSNESLLLSIGGLGAIILGIIMIFVIYFKIR